MHEEDKDLVITRLKVKLKNQRKHLRFFNKRYDRDLKIKMGHHSDVSYFLRRVAELRSEKDALKNWVIFILLIVISFLIF